MKRRERKRRKGKKIFKEKIDLPFQFNIFNVIFLRWIINFFSPQQSPLPSSNRWKTFSSRFVNVEFWSVMLMGSLTLLLPGWKIGCLLLRILGSIPIMNFLEDGFWYLKKPIFLIMGIMSVWLKMLVEKYPVLLKLKCQVSTAFVIVFCASKCVLFTWCCVFQFLRYF